MNGALDHRSWRADLSAYILGALEPDEAAALESHLEDCGRCRDELRWLQPAVDMLPESIEQLDPPPRLRERLLDEVGADAGQTPRAAAAAERRRSGGGMRRFFLRPAVALGMVALVVAAIAGYSLGIAGRGDDAATTTVAATGLGELRATLKHSGDEGTLRMTGLRQAPSSHVYQAWVQHDDRIEPASLFDAGRDGTATVALPRSIERADAVMVTIEPRGGSRQPSSTPLVDLALAN